MQRIKELGKKENSTKVLGAELGAFREWSLNQGVKRSLSGLHISPQTSCVLGSLPGQSVDFMRAGVTLNLFSPLSTEHSMNFTHSRCLDNTLIYILPINNAIRNPK